MREKSVHTSSHTFKIRLRRCLVRMSHASFPLVLMLSQQYLLQVLRMLKCNGLTTTATSYRSSQSNSLVGRIASLHPRAHLDQTWGSLLSSVMLSTVEIVSSFALQNKRRHQQK